MKQQRSGRIDQATIKHVAQESDLQLIYKLDLSISNLNRIEQLELVPKLRCLILNYNRIAELEGLRVVPDLRELHLQNNLLVRLGGLDGNKNLTVLNLANNQIEKIENIGALTRLDTLNLSNNRLTRLSGIDNLKEMKQLYLHNNAIEVLEYIPGFSRLETINLSNNRIKAILPNFFQNCAKLLRLDLSNNEIKKAEFIEPLTNLEQLQLANNRLELFMPDSVYPHLDQLDLSGNELSDLPYFPNMCPQLMSLNLANNYITNEVTLLQAIAGHESLVELDFQNNPMYSESFESAIGKLHNLDSINGKGVNQPGNKYKQKIDDIVREFRQFPEVYMRDDEEDRAIKLSGFNSEELELELTGVKPNRPPSPQRRTVKPYLIQLQAEKNSEFITSQQQFNEWLKQSNQKVEQMRTRYLQIFASHGIQPPKPQEIEDLDRTSDTPTSSRELQSQKQLDAIRSEQERQLNKWKDAKAKEKTFNIRDLKYSMFNHRKKKSVLEERADKPAGSLPKFTRKAEKMDMLKTQQLTAFDQKILNDAMLTRTQQRTFRPQSLKK